MHSKLQPIQRLSSAGGLKKRLTAFTLIELLVVISIVVLLISILLPALQAARDASQTSVCLSNLRQQGIAFGSYAAENNDMIPNVSDETSGSSNNPTNRNWAIRLTKQMSGNGATYTYSGQTYTRGAKVFKCPSDSLYFKPAYGFEAQQLSYFINNEKYPTAVEGGSQITTWDATGGGRTQVGDFRCPMGKRVSSIPNTSDVIMVNCAYRTIAAWSARSYTFAGSHIPPFQSYLHAQYGSHDMYGHSQYNATTTLMVDGHAQSFSRGTLDGHNATVATGDTNVEARRYWYIKGTY